MDDTVESALSFKPSVRRVLNHADSIINEIKSHGEFDFPPEAIRARQLIVATVDYLRDRLLQLQAAPSDDLSRAPAVRAISRDLQELFTYLRYLRASSHHQTPPSIQMAAAHLTSLFFPSSKHGTPLTIVRPQWKYNLAFAALGRSLQSRVATAHGDPSSSLKKKSTPEVLEFLWERWWAKQDVEAPAAPQQVGVISFSGLDTDDPLALPILAHELAHFIDNSYSPWPASIRILNQVNISFQDVADIAGDLAEKNPIVVTTAHNNFTARLQTCISELLADRLATRMMGLSYFMAQAERLKGMANESEPIILPNGYPGAYYRLSQILLQLTQPKYVGDAMAFLVSRRNDPAAKTTVEFLLNYLVRWTEQTRDYKSFDGWGVDHLYNQLEDRLNVCLKDALKLIVAAAEEAIPGDACASLSNRFFDRIKALELDRPPIFPDDTPNCCAEIATAAWVYHLMIGARKEEDLQAAKGESTAGLERDKTTRLIWKALELLPTTNRHVAPRDVIGLDTRAKTKVVRGPWRTGVLSSSDLQHRLHSEKANPQKHIFVVPYRPDAIQGASLDVHLGHWFSSAKRGRTAGIKINAGDSLHALRKTPDYAYVRSGQHFTLHPGDFALGITLEFVAVPPDLVAFVEGRSGLARMGLVISSASQVAPGFHGCLVLELSNLGPVAIEIEPGTRVGQLVFHSLTADVPEDGLYKNTPYYCQVKP